MKRRNLFKKGVVTAAAGAAVTLAPAAPLAQRIAPTARVVVRETSLRVVQVQSLPYKEAMRYWDAWKAKGLPVRYLKPTETTTHIINLYNKAGDLVRKISYY